MKRTMALLYGSIVLSASAMAAGYAFAGYWLGSIIAFVWAGLWAISVVRQTFKFSSLALIGYAILVVQAVGVSVGPGWLLLALVACLAGWDLEYLVTRLLDVEEEPVADEIATNHFQQLGITLTVGLLVAGAALVIQYRINFWLMLLFGFLAAIGLTRFIALIRQARG